MKTSLPITNVETNFLEGESIYLSTDLQDNIVKANKAFAAISNFSHEKMIGLTHSMLRHREMPPEAFADMWRDLKAGRPWRGVVGE